LVDLTGPRQHSSRVLVTDGEQRSSLAVVRALGRAGYSVEICSSRSRPLAGASRYCVKAHRTPEAEGGPASCLKALGELIEQRDIDVLLPMTDATASVALSLRSTYPRLVIPFPPRETWDLVADKAELVKAAAGVGIPVPRQVVANDPQSGVGGAHQLAREVGYPLVLKPHRSAVVRDIAVSRFGVRIVSREEELASSLRLYKPEAYPILIQQSIEGPGLGAFFLAKDGVPLASFAHRRLREKPPTGGVSVLCESVALRRDVEQYAEALLRHFTWSGVAMVEFKEDSSTGTPYLMEINGRFWGSLQLAIDAGVDFPTLLVRSALGEEIESPKSYRVGVRNRWLWGDMDHLLWMLRAPRNYRESYPFLPSRVAAVARFLIPWRRGEHYEVLKPWDLRPFARESAEWFRAVLERREPRRRQ
jgi:predicted ATP-grasp superfamily ATP-dependent carboligase